MQGSSSSNILATQLDGKGTSCYICDCYLGFNMQLAGVPQKGLSLWHGTAHQTFQFHNFKQLSNVTRQVKSCPMRDRLSCPQWLITVQDSRWHQ